MFPIIVQVNGVSRQFNVEPQTLLSSLLRETLALTGTHIGCDTAQCGCCTVLVDGDAVKSCTMLAVQADGNCVTTIEGLAPSGDLHPLQKAFHACHALQCGYCTPGFIMSSAELVEKYRDLDEGRVRDLLDGNMCRCTGYNNIVKAVMTVASDLGHVKG